MTRRGVALAQVMEMRADNPPQLVHLHEFFD